MMTIARPSLPFSPNDWRLFLGFIAAIHILLPMLLLLTFPAIARVPRGWIGAAFFTGQLLCLSYTVAALSLRIRSLSILEIGLVALTTFL